MSGGRSMTTGERDSLITVVRGMGLAAVVDVLIAALREQASGLHAAGRWHEAGLVRQQVSLLLEALPPLCELAERLDSLAPISVG
jgi:hypothetical protein